MKYLICGLGNIGPEYELTRHNVGFLTLDRLAERAEIDFTGNRLADKANFKHKGRQIHLIKPTTYMNLSGKALAYWMQQLKITRENVLIIVDDIALPFGALRLRTKGSSAGHNGLGNIEELLASQEYPRLRMGIGNDFPRGGQVNYVLSNFSSVEVERLPEIMDQAIQIIFSFCTIGAMRTMNLFNKN